MPLDLSELDHCPDCDSTRADHTHYACEKCHDEIAICCDCRLILVPCKCGHCETGSQFRESGDS